ncbi:asparagine synthase (glutamine-hydrolyzing) [Pedobacter sp. SYSU D00535]|uniref:asparagine synthase (glutamine-hydrolyzing) n=1 Tax=Pedobacter sp. SYSU D00535 TaxID=2810308 RepID=UPI001A962C7B|nr:asparagine synthase (glutamine-hydrolyzing) [Pedobacter sp. SYSU D00535]
MCGIFGTLNHKVSPQRAEIFDGLFHRGPDEQASISCDNTELFHTRLAIQDLGLGGKQPMEYNGLYLVFNGEIYNHLELRDKYGLKSESNSDTRTILLLFELLGIRMLDDFDGMFAFALYDSRNHSLYLARDRAGKKPLYVYNDGKKLAFSSELNILYRVMKPQINYESVADYLYLGYYYRKATPYIHVKELENGHYLKVDTTTGHSTDIQWYSIENSYNKKHNISYHEALDQLDHKLNIAVKRRLDSSDLDVGSFLSGGIDSGLVTAIAAANSRSLKTFTVRMEGAYDESSLAQKVSERYGTDHTVVDISFSDLQNEIEELLINYGEPFCDNSAIPSYYVAKAAKKHITVVLNGDGADELFGGYRRYVPFRHFDFFKSSSITHLAAKTLIKFLPVANEKKSRYNYMYRLLKFAGFSDPLKLYSSASSDIFVGFENQFIYRPALHDITQNLTGVNNLSVSSLDKLLLMDFQTILFSGLLPKMDIATMANSLEGRSPFLSKELLEFAPGLDESYKINSITTKYILRDLAKRYLPAELIQQPKRGFEVPLKQWVDTSLKEIIESYLLSSNTLYEKIIKKDFIKALLTKKVPVSAEKRAKMIFCVFALEVWYKNLQ